MILVISILALLVIPSAALAKDKSYSINHANVDLTIQSNGLVHIKGSLFYSFNGTYNAVSRNIPLKNGLSLDNINVTVNGAYNSFQINDIKSNTKQIQTNLYSDIEKTKPITDKDVKVILGYDIVNFTILYNDIGLVNYQLWDENWKVDVGYVDGVVQFNSSFNIQYWINPSYVVNTTQLKDSTLYLRSNQINSGNYFARENKTVDGLSIITKKQKEEENGINFKNTFYPIIAILMILSVLIPIGTYFKYGREPKISYDGIYEREIPTNDSPAFVNSISGSGVSKDIGELNMDGFSATIMDLINRKCLSIIPKEDNELAKSTNLKINNSDFSQLKLFEKDVINFLNKYEISKGIDLNLMNERLNERKNTIEFKNSFDSWVDDLKKVIGKIKV
jgi:uncharacterized membrane protein